MPATYESKPVVLAEQLLSGDLQQALDVGLGIFFFPLRDQPAAGATQAKHAPQDLLRINAVRTGHIQRYSPYVHFASMALSGAAARQARASLSCRLAGWNRVLPSLLKPSDG